MRELKQKADEMAKLCQATDVWSTSRQMVSNVFNAYPVRAFSAEQVFKIACAVDALAECDENKVHIQDALTFWCRKKMLRSRPGRMGCRLYEVNG